MISDTSPKAKSIINMLKELAQDYPFLNVYEDDFVESDELLQELDAR